MYIIYYELQNKRFRYISIENTITNSFRFYDTKNYILIVIEKKSISLMILSSDFKLTGGQFELFYARVREGEGQWGNH